MEVSLLMLRISALLEPRPGGRQHREENSCSLVLCTPETFNRHFSSSQMTDLTECLTILWGEASDMTVVFISRWQAILYLQSSDRHQAIPLGGTCAENGNSSAHRHLLYGRLMWASESMWEWEKHSEAELRQGLKQYESTGACWEAETAGSRSLAQHMPHRVRDLNVVLAKSFSNQKKRMVISSCTSDWSRKRH